MLFDTLILPSQAVVPLGVALAHLALGLFVIFNRQHNGDVLSRFFIAYLLVSALWNIDLVLAVAKPPSFLPITWAQLMAYGFVLLGVLYWAFGRAYLQQSWKAPWGWAIAAVGLVLILCLDMRWIPLPAQAFSWSNGWISAENIGFIVGVVCWAILMAITLVTTVNQLLNTQNPAHRNRIQYLIITTVLLLIGYLLYLALLQSAWPAGLIVTWLGSALASYIVVEEELLDLSTRVRRTIDLIIAVLVTMAVYVAGIYLVQIFLGDFLASTFLVRFMNPTLVVAAVTAALLTIVYTPIRQLSRKLTHGILYGRD